MNENITKDLDELINLIDHSDLVKDIKTLKLAITKDSTLMKQIKAFQRDKDHLNKTDLVKRRQELYQNRLVKQYQTKINELNLLIRDLNQTFKTISPDLRCQKGIFD